MTNRVWLAAAVAGLVILGVPFKGTYLNDATFTATVSRVEYRFEGSNFQGSGNMRTQYLVFTDAGVLANEDSLMRLKFNSSDIRAAIEAGMTYCFHTNWWRFGMFSWYRNILDVTPGRCESSVDA